MLRYYDRIIGRRMSQSGATECVVGIFGSIVTLLPPMLKGYLGDSNLPNAFGRLNGLAAVDPLPKVH